MSAPVEVHGSTRGAFLLRGAMAAGAALGTGAVGPFVSRALAAADTSDVDIVNFALTLEYLETAFYKDALKLGLSGDAKTFAKQFGATEAQHVAALTATVKQLGGTPAKQPTFSFPMKTQKDFLKLAATLEDTGVSAYNGAGPAIKSKEVLGAAGTIVQVEARHAAVIRMLNGENPAPDAFDRTLDTEQVQHLVQPFIA
jgi:rubrerythrin